MLAQLSVEELLPLAVRAYTGDDLERARVLFERVHALAPTARTFRSLALVALRQARFSEAIALFEASLASEVRPLTGVMREDALKLLTDARALVPTEPRQLEAPVDLASPAPRMVASTPPAEMEDSPIHANSIARKQRQTGQTAQVHDTGAVRTRRLRRAGAVLVVLSGAALITSGATFATGLIRLERIADHCKALPDGQCLAAEVDARRHAARLDLLSTLSVAGVVVGSVLGVGSASTLAFSFRATTNHTGGERSARITLYSTF